MTKLKLAVASFLSLLFQQATGFALIPQISVSPSLSTFKNVLDSTREPLLFHSNPSTSPPTFLRSWSALRLQTADTAGAEQAQSDAETSASPLNIISIGEVFGGKRLVSQAADGDGSEQAHERRQELKAKILNLSEKFAETQAAMFQMMDDEEEKQRLERKKSGLFRRIFGRRGKKVSSGRAKETSGRMLGLFGSESFDTIMVELGERGEEIIALAEELATLNPTEVPTYGWQGYGGGRPSDSLLDGVWKLRFTSGADATFRDSPSRGKATTSQVVDATKGTFTNTIDFEKGKVTGFRVVVEGEALSDTDVGLTFKRVIILRNSGFFKRIVIPLPSFRFLRRFAKLLSRGRSSKPFTIEEQRQGPYFVIQFLEKDFRMHKTGDGNWFIQTRIQE